MRDEQKTLIQGTPTGTDAVDVGEAGPESFRSTFRSGSAPPPPEDGDERSANRSGMRRLDLGDVSSKSTLLSQNAPPAPETLRSSSGHPMEATPADVLHVPSVPHLEGLTGRTLHGLPKTVPPKRGPQARGDVRAARVQSIGEASDDGRDTGTAATFKGRATDPDPHAPSVQAEPVDARAADAVHRSRQARPVSMPEDRPVPPASLQAPTERPSLVMLARNRVLNKVLFGALGLAAVVVLGSEMGLLDGGSSPSPEATETAPADTNAVGVAAANAPEPATKAASGPTTMLESVPTGAEIVWHGAVIANTPAEVPRDRQDGDYLLRKRGYETQLVRIGDQSPKTIRLELKAIGAATAPQAAAADEASPSAADDRTTVKH